jgi:DNA-binding transcriptional ArsR family regulator
LRWKKSDAEISAQRPQYVPRLFHIISKMLTDAGLIESRREGQGVYYSSIPSRLKAFMAYLRSLSAKERPQLIGVPDAMPGRPKKIKKSRRTVLEAMRAGLR